MNEDEKHQLLEQLLKDINPVFKITGEAVSGGKYTEIDIKNIKIMKDFKLYSGSELFSAKVGETDSTYIKYKGDY